MHFKATYDIDCSQRSTFKVDVTSRGKPWSLKSGRLKSVDIIFWPIHINSGFI